MKALSIALALAVVSTPALARKADHKRKHHHARMAVTETAPPFGFGPMAGAPGWQAQGWQAQGWQAQPPGWQTQTRTRAPRVARDTAPGQGAYSAMVQRHAAANGIPASLVHRVIMRESRYNPRAVSKGNYGMMQIKLGTARAMGYTGSAAGLLDPETNMTYAVKYLAGAYKVAGGSESGAVSNYARGYYYQAKRRGVSPYEAPGTQAFAMQPGMQPAVVMQTSEPRTRRGRTARASGDFYVRTPSDRHTVF